MAEKNTPHGAVIEIIEKRNTGPDKNGILVPNDVRINGQSLMCPADAPVIVHEMPIDASTPVQVTLTLWAKRIIVGAEAPEENSDG